MVAQNILLVVIKGLSFEGSISHFVVFSYLYQGLAIFSILQTGSSQPLLCKIDFTWIYVKC